VPPTEAAARGATSRSAPPTSAGTSRFAWSSRRRSRHGEPGQPHQHDHHSLLAVQKNGLSPRSIVDERRYPSEVVQCDELASSLRPHGIATLSPVLTGPEDRLEPTDRSAPSSGSSGSGRRPLEYFHGAVRHLRDEHDVAPAMAGLQVQDRTASTRPTPAIRLAHELHARRPSNRGACFASRSGGGRAGDLFGRRRGAGLGRTVALGLRHACRPVPLRFRRGAGRLVDCGVASRVLFFG